jgi:hypothetical protein
MGKHLGNCKRHSGERSEQCGPAEEYYPCGIKPLSAPGVANVLCNDTIDLFVHRRDRNIDLCFASKRGVLITELAAKFVDTFKPFIGGILCLDDDLLERFHRLRNFGLAGKDALLRCQLQAKFVNTVEAVLDAFSAFSCDFSNDARIASTSLLRANRACVSDNCARNSLKSSKRLSSAASAPRIFSFAVVSASFVFTSTMLKHRSYFRSRSCIVSIIYSLRVTVSGS